MLFGLYNISTLVNDIYHLSLKEAEKNQKIETLENEKKRLNEKLSFVNSNDFIEKEARTKLNMKKENEQIYVVNNGSEKALSDDKELAVRVKKPILSKWMEVIF